MSIEKIKAPITPEIVLLGLILVSFFLLIIYQKSIHQDQML